MESPKHIVIYSHGFGVRKDDIGLFTDVAASLPEVESVLFEYNDIDETTNTLTIRPFSVQAQMLNEEVRKARTANPDAVIDLICHSQGTIVAALAKPQGLRKVLLLSPVVDLSAERSLARIRDKYHGTVDLDGITTYTTSIGTIVVPAQYWSERKVAQPIQEYDALAQLAEVIMVKPEQDNVLGDVDLSGLDPKIKILTLPGDHSFNGGARAALLKCVRDLIL